jgi:predicted SnoaL-like aldol condensation-catalyzing enzyme
VKERQERSQQTALDFYHPMFNQRRPADAIECAGDTYTQHNPEVEDGKQQASIDDFVPMAKDPGSGPRSSRHSPTLMM